MNVAGTLQPLASGLELVLPETVLLAMAAVLIVAAAVAVPEGRLGPARLRHFCGFASLAALAVAAGFWLNSVPVDRSQIPMGLFRLDELAWFLKGLALATGVVLLLVGWNQVGNHEAAEVHACLLTILAGAGLTASANDLISLFLALELVSIPTYVFLYLPRRDAASQEAVIKYFLLSIFSSAVVLYGFSLLYGVAGTTELGGVQAALGRAGDGSGAALLGVVAAIAGLSFRATAVPFHFYAPDVFQGIPTAGAALLSFLPKIVGFAALLRLLAPSLSAGPLGAAAGDAIIEVAPLLCVLAALSMFVGNLLALLQSNLKRLLAYSSIAHAGYMLVGLAAGGRTASAVTGTEAVLFYLAVYGAMTLGVFAVLVWLSRPEYSVESIEDLAGLSRTRPAAAFLLALFLFSLAGLPPTAGFLGKFTLFWAAWSQGTAMARGLAILLAVNAAIAAWYYLRNVAAMYLQAPVRPFDHEQPADKPAVVGSALCAAATIGLFLAPNWFWAVIESASL
jgi:NADH-quinone oxidoreductase subunit N